MEALLITICFVVLFSWRIYQFVQPNTEKRGLSFLDFLFDLYTYLRLLIYRRRIHNTVNQFRYYNRLPIALKKEYVKRVNAFITEKKFIRRYIGRLAFEQKVKIANSAIQISFGLDNYLMPRYNRILVFKEPYYSKQTNQMHKGETNLKGIIALSLSELDKGNENPDDGINLGLHEMAHALRFNALLDSNNNSFFNYYFSELKEASTTDFEELISGKQSKSLFREYAKSNFEEFFAVCVENFFERTTLMKKEYPELFESQKVLLNQNPECDNPVLESPQRSKVIFNKTELIESRQLFTSTPVFPNILIPLLPLFIFEIISGIFIPKNILIFYVGICILLNIILSFFVKCKFRTHEKVLIIDTLSGIRWFSKMIPLKNITGILYSDAPLRKIEIRYLGANQVNKLSFYWTGLGREMQKMQQVLIGLGIKSYNKRKHYIKDQ